MQLKNMKLAKEEKKEYAQPTVVDSPEYPWGLQLNLDHDTLEKLGVKNLPPVGTKVVLQAKAEVCSCESYENKEGGKRLSMRLQITDLALGAEEPAAVDAEKVLYKS